MLHTDLLNEARARIFARLDLLAKPNPADLVPVDHEDWVTYSTSVCSFCRESVTFANSKMVQEPLDYGDQPVYHGMATHLQLRVCRHH